MGRNFSNKIWNAMKFVLMNCEDDISFANVDASKFTLEDKWILTGLNRLIADATNNIEKYEFGVALSKIVDFLWDNFCDWYIEITKSRLFDKECESRLEAQYLLNHVLGTCMSLLHPFMPFITEEVYSNLILDCKSESIMISDWPVADEKSIFDSEAAMMTTLMDAIRSIRNVRAQMGVASSRKTHIIVVTPEDTVAKMFVDGEGFLERLASVSSLETQKDKAGIPVTAVVAIFDGGEVYIPLEDLIDIDKELERLSKEKESILGELKRVEGKLGNEAFVSKAPEKVISAEKEKQAKYLEMFKGIEERISLLSQEK